MCELALVVADAAMPTSVAWCRDRLLHEWKKNHAPLNRKLSAAKLASDWQQQGWAPRDLTRAINAAFDSATAVWNACQPSQPEVDERVVAIWEAGLQNGTAIDAVYKRPTEDVLAEIVDERSPTPGGKDWSFVSNRQVQIAQAAVRKEACDHSRPLTQEPVDVLMAREAAARRALHELQVERADGAAAQQDMPLPPPMHAAPEVRRVFFQHMFGASYTLHGVAFNENDDTHWQRVRWRYINARQQLCLPPLRTVRLRLQDRLDYTPEEAQFCAMFDAFADQWECAQQELVDATEGIRACDVCKERRPPWMTTVRCVDVNCLDTGLTSGDVSPDNQAKWNAHVQTLHGKWLCDRCRAPSLAEKNAGVHKFSAANRAVLTELPHANECARLQALTAQQLDIELRNKENWFKSFAIATDAELAFVRMTIPCVRLKMLKYGGMLSQSHSVRVPLPLACHLQHAAFVVYAGMRAK